VFSSVWWFGLFCAVFEHPCSCVVGTQEGVDIGLDPDMRQNMGSAAFAFVSRSSFRVQHLLRIVLGVRQVPTAARETILEIAKRCDASEQPLAVPASLAGLQAGPRALSYLASFHFSPAVLPVRACRRCSSTLARWSRSRFRSRMRSRWRCSWSDITSTSFSRQLPW
jgi:hypothetical protein